MNRIITLFVLLLSISLKSQVIQTTSSYTGNFVNEYSIGEERHILLNNGFFYDAGGSEGSAGLEEKITTLHADEGILSVYFEYLEIPAGAELWIFSGKSTEEEPIAVAYRGDKLPNIEGEHLTFFYKPPAFFDGNDAAGWKAIVSKFSYDTKNNKVTWPESDCPFAIPLCDNTSVMTGLEQYEDLGVINDDDGTCYSGTGSGGSVWYSFTPETNGLLDFTISPSGSTDYDFVLWDITNGCASGERIQMSCNYSLYTGPTGLHDVNCGIVEGDDTGDCGTDSKGSSYNRFNRRKQVYTNKRYAICVNFYSGQNHGFTLSFQMQPTSVSIGDNSDPYVTNSYTGTCTLPTTITIFFNEWVDCSTIDPTDFVLPGYTFTIIDDHCQNGRTLSVELGVSPALPSGNYSIGVSGITDMCGNVMNSSYPLLVGTPVTADAGPDKVTCRSGSALFGYSYSPSSQSLSAGGSGGTQWLWSNGMNTQTVNVSPTQTTTYYVTVTNSGCYDVDTVTVFVEHPSANAGPDQTICAGFPTTLTGTGGVTYQWYSNPGWFNNGTPVPGGNTATITVSPGATTTYRVVVTTANGCTAYDDVKITTGSGSFSASATPAIICEGTSTTLTVPGAITDYQWDGGPSNLPWTVSPAVSTTYTVTSTTAGCTGTASVTVNVRELPDVLASGVPLSICTGESVQLNSTPSASSSTLTEDFEGATQSFTLVNGTYNKWYQGTATNCNGSKSLFIGTNATTYNYVNWSGLSAAAATNFAYKDVTITGNNIAELSFNWKCLGKSTDHLTVWAIPITTTPVAGTVITAGGGNMMLGGPYWNASASCNPETIDLSQFSGSTIRLVFQWTNVGGFLFSNSAAPPPAAVDDIVINQSSAYAYTWTSIPAGFNSSNQNVTVPSVNSNTTFYVEVTDPLGCSNIDSVEVLVVPGPVVELGPDTSLCPGDILVLDAGAGYTYEWSTFESTQTITVTTDGTYTVTVSSGTNCSTVDQITVTFSGIYDATITSGNSFCINDGSQSFAAVDGGGAWSGPGISSGGIFEPTVAGAGTHQIVYTISGTCGDSDTMMVTVHDLPAVSLGPNVAICSGDNVVLDAGSGFSQYSWNPAGNSQTFTASSPGTYTVTVTDGNGCQGSASVTVSIQASFDATITSGIEFCINAGNQNFTAVDGGGTWSGTGVSSGGVFNPSSAGAGVHEIIYTISGSCGDADTVNVTVYAAPVVNLGPDATICNGESLTLDAGPGSTYTWTPSGSTQTIIVSAGGTYSVVVTDGNGCEGTDAIQITVISQQDATIITTGPFCSNDSPVQFTAQDPGGVWSGTGINAGGMFNPTTAGVGTHTITYGIAGNCGDTASTTITVYAAPVVDLGADTTICEGESLILDAGPGSAWQWSPSGSTQTINVTTGGTYSVTVTDGNTCQGTDAITVTVLDQQDATILTDGPFCSNDSPVQFQSEDGGGSWSGTGISGTGLFNPTTAGPGTHTITYVIAGSCGDTDTQDVLVNEAPLVSITHNNESCIGADDGDAILVIVGGTSPFTILWSNGSSQQTLEGLIPGDYSVLVTDQNGCSNSGNVSILGGTDDCNPPHVWVPNVFSPNGDGENDVLFVRGEGIQFLEFIIYDRWGEKVFETTTKEIGWDGTFRGVKCDPAVFTYVMKVMFSNQSEEQKFSGTVTLVQ